MTASAESYDFRLNSKARVATLPIGVEREQVIRVDALLARPEMLVDYAARAVRFAAAGTPTGGYPGLQAPAPLNYVESVVRAMHPIIERVFALDGVLLSSATCALSLTTTPPEDLTLQQRAPHIDTTDPLQFALLHYLCPEHVGGTGFYRHRATGCETVRGTRAVEYDAVRARELADTPPRPGYIRTDDAHFIRIGGCDAAFNRLVIYRSCLLHSGDIAGPSALIPDPRNGRLTANIFVTYPQG